MKLKIVNKGKPNSIMFSARCFETDETIIFAGDELALSLPDDIELTVTLNNQLCKNQ